MRYLTSLFSNSILIKVIGLNSFSVGVRLVCGFLYNMLLARIVGPSGLVVLGNLGSLMRSLQTTATLGLEAGIISKAAEEKENQTISSSVLKTGLTMILIGSVLSALFLLIGASWISRVVLFDETYATVIRSLSVSIIFYSLFIYLTSLMQGWQHYQRFIWLNVLMAVVTFSFSAIAVWYYSLLGAVWAIAIAPFLQLAVTLVFFKKKQRSFSEILRLQFDRQHAASLIRFAIMGLLSAVLVPVSLIYVRTLLKDSAGEIVAGWYEGILRLSGYYTLFVTSLVSIYVLPEFSKSAEPAVFRKVIFRYFKTLLPLLSLGLLGIYFFRQELTLLVFGKEFYGMDSLFAYQLIGDFFKTISVALAIWFIARNNLRDFIITEVISVIVFTAAATYFIRPYGAVGAVMGHMIAYIVYTVAVVSLLRKEIFKLG